MVYVVRAKYNNVLCPGWALQDFSAAHIGYEGQEVLVNEFEALAILPGQQVEWIEVPGTFDLAKLRGMAPVIGGYDPNHLPYFIAKGLGGGKGTNLSGKVSSGHCALIPWSGRDNESTDYWYYSVLVHSTKTLQTAQLGSFQSLNDRTTVQPDNWNTFTFDTSKFRSSIYTPSFFIGLRYIDSATHLPTIGVRAYIEQDFSREQVCKIGRSPAGGTLYNGGVDWLATDISAPELQMGLFNTNDLPHMPNPPVPGIGNVVHRIKFENPYPTPPKVIVCLTGFETYSSTRYSLKAYAMDIDRRGFTLNITTGSNEVQLIFAMVNWIAVAEDLPSIVVGGFSSENTTQGTLSSGGRLNFGKWFKSSPTVIVGLNGFDGKVGSDLRLSIKAEDVQVDGMKWKFDTWADTVLKGASAAFLAIEMPQESR